MADINTFGNPTYFNNDVTFYKDVTIGGEFKYDNLSVKTLSVENSFSVGDDVKISSGIVTATKFVGNGADLTGIVTIPTGVIVMWSGAVSAIPSGWVLCDGTNSTPDLRDRFIVGAGVSYSVDDTGGSADAVVVSHTHSITQTSHSHSYTTNQGTGGGQGGGGADTGSTNKTTGGANANITINDAGVSGTNANLPPYYALAFIMKT
jgi:hypothetical protein